MNVSHQSFSDNVRIHSFIDVNIRDLLCSTIDPFLFTRVGQSLADRWCRIVIVTLHHCFDVQDNRSEMSSSSNDWFPLVDLNVGRKNIYFSSRPNERSAVVLFDHFGCSQCRQGFRRRPMSFMSEDWQLAMIEKSTLCRQRNELTLTIARCSITRHRLGRFQEMARGDVATVWLLHTSLIDCRRRAVCSRCDGLLLQSMASQDRGKGSARKIHRSRWTDSGAFLSPSEFATGKGVDEWIETGIAIAQPEANGENHSRFERGPCFWIDRDILHMHFLLVENDVYLTDREEKKEWQPTENEHSHDNT